MSRTAGTIGGWLLVLAAGIAVAGIPGPEASLELDALMAGYAAEGVFSGADVAPPEAS